MKLVHKDTNRRNNVCSRAFNILNLKLCYLLWIVYTQHKKYLIHQTCMYIDRYKYMVNHVKSYNYLTKRLTTVKGEKHRTIKQAVMCTSSNIALICTTIIKKKRRIVTVINANL